MEPIAHAPFATVPAKVVALGEPREEKQAEAVTVHVDETRRKSDAEGPSVKGQTSVE